MNPQKKKMFAAIHCKPRHGYSEYSVFYGSNPRGPRGGRCGLAVDGECIVDGLHFAPALRAAEEVVAAHPGARLLLTASQAAAADALHKARIVIA